MRRGLEAAVVLLLAFVVLPFAVVATMSARVPAWLWVALVVSCTSYIPARLWSTRP